MDQKLNLGVLILFLPFFVTCTNESCNDEPTFTQMAGSLKDSTQTSLTAVITWSKGQDLPKTYFEQIHLITGSISHDGSNWKNDFATVDRTFILSDTSLEIVFYREKINNSLDTIDIHYQFPDRRNFIYCEHLGSSDSYFLDLQLLFSKDANDLKVRLLTWEESLLKGPF